VFDGPPKSLNTLLVGAVIDDVDVVVWVALVTLEAFDVVPVLVVFDPVDSVIEKVTTM
jgi:hypothetical protein